MLRTRVLTAAALLGAFIAALVWLGREQFAVVAAGIVGLGAHEWARLLHAGRGAAATYAVLCAAACVALVQAIWLAPWVCAAATVFWLTMAPYRVARGFAPGRAGAGIAAGMIVLIPAGLAMAVLPPAQLLMVLGLIWISDTGAYLAGRAFGRHKLAPRISPGKTWEGVAGGAIGCIIYAIIWAFSDPELRTRVQGIAWVPFLAGAMLLCAAGVVGDLFESGLKRQAGAKDSGKLLPGHGGVLDRIDSATAALPVALVLMQAMSMK